MSTGEQKLARSVFGTALALNQIHVHDRPYLPGQARGVAMSPNGGIWFNPTDFKQDFSLNVGDAAWLVHELTHVWQYQTGRSVRMRGLLEQLGRLRGIDPYVYGKLDPSRRFSSYKNEQQAAIVEDYYRVRKRMTPRFGAGTLEQYEAAIPFVPKTVALQRPARG